ncbi:LOW QUALITY PROTEIN: hypothetical protein CFOL_v3_19828, partial [Cephalotus follicularis]
FLSSTLSFSTSSSSSYLVTPTSLVYLPNHNSKRDFILCQAIVAESSPPCAPSPILPRRGLLITSLVFLLAGKRGYNANTAILEADDDVLLEKVKRGKKKRLERQGVISSSNEETGYLQDLVYKLSKVGQAIENNDLSIARKVLKGSPNTDWVHKANVAFTKLTSSPEGKTEVDTFNSALASLISSVTRNDVEFSKVDFVASAGAFEKWTTLTGVVGLLKGL